MKGYFTFPLLLFFFTQVIAEDAKQYYNAGKFDEALFALSKLENEGNKGSELYFNKAMCHYKLSEYPSAILYFEKALKWDPNCESCLQMLSVSQKKTGLELYALPENKVIGIYFSVLNQWPTLIWFMAALLLISFTLYLNYYWQRADRYLKFPYFINALLVVAVISLLMAAHREYLFLKSDQFILMMPVALKKSPDEKSPDIQQLLAGMKLKKTLQLGTWIKVETTEFDSGWVPADKLAAISL
ncbi:MAG: tetratricopeptide repeat protein [Saprospiraceae bacterium]|nr:tetratricopeptide repeat protein [Saprospiraceae bacterium]